MRRSRIVMLSVVAAAAAALFLAMRVTAEETCFDRLGGPGPNSNTSRLDTTLTLPANQWPAVAAIFREFAAERGWLVNEGRATGEDVNSWIDMCDMVTIVRGSDQSGEGGQIGFGIIHMNYEGPGALAWHAHYRELHRRLEARWPGRMRYVEGEFLRPIGRPDWLDRPADQVR